MIKHILFKLNVMHCISPYVVLMRGGEAFKESVKLDRKLMSI